MNNNRGASLIKSDASLDLLEDALSEQGFFLAPLSKKIAGQWSEIYLSTFGRSAFFSAQRVHRIFEELVDTFISCVQEKRLDLYFDHLKERGVSFSRLGVPFDEVIVSLHIFEDVCLQEFLNSKIHRPLLHKIMGVMGELHHQGLAVLAASYFETTKKEMQKITDSFIEENQSLKSELSEMRDSLFVHTAKELTSMQLMISGINQKLRQRVYQLSRVQKISEVLDGESHLPRLLKIASSQVLALCPAHSNLYFGFFDDDRKNVGLYHQESNVSPECNLVKSFYFSELTEAFQSALYDESKRHAHFKSFDFIPGVLTEIPAIRNQKDFLLIPIRKYREVIGFVFLGVPADDFFSKNNYKFYQRVGLVISKAISGALLFKKSKQHDQFEFILEELDRQKLQHQPLETTLDFCLGSMIDLMGVERSSLMRYDEQRRELKVCAAKGYKVYPITGAIVKWGEGIAGTALRDSKIISISKMRDPKHSDFLNSVLRQNGAPQIKIKSLLCTPLSDAEKPLGVLNMSTINYYHPFDKSDIEMAHHIIRRMTGLLKNLAQNEESETAG